MVETVPGTAGYEAHKERFIRISQALDFAETNVDFLPYLPEPGASVLDAGGGAGQNACALAMMGYEVVALDPLESFLDAARLAYHDVSVKWMNDSLPGLSQLSSMRFDFVLVDGVWHHLSPDERGLALARLAELMLPHGRCAISLRNGPAGMGSHVFSTCLATTISDGADLGLRCIFKVEDQPSLLPGKEAVRWARLVLDKE